MSTNDATPGVSGTHPRFGRRQRAGLVLVLVALAAVTWWLSEQSRPAATAVSASGTIEADQATLTVEVGGQLRSFLVDEGQSVKAGEPLAKVDTAMLEAQVKQAQSVLDVARANALLVQAGARPEEVRQLEAALAQATSARDGAKAAWENAKEVQANPQELGAKVAVARPQLAAAQARLDRLKAGATQADKDAAQAALAIAQAKYDQTVKGLTSEQRAVLEQQLKVAKNQEYLTQQNVEELTARTNDGTSHSVQIPLFSKEIGRAQSGVAWEQTKLVEAQIASATAPPTPEVLAQLQGAIDQATAQLAKVEQGATPADLRAAEADVAAAQANLDSLLQIQSGSQMAKAQVDAAYAQLQTAEGGVAAAQARLDAARKGATAEQLAVAGAPVRQAEAALGILQVQMDKSTPKAPRDGVVLQRLVSAGENVVAGTRLLSVAGLDEVFVTIYVPETQYGRMMLGQEVTVHVDSYAGETFTGKVVRIAEQAEYTPRNVQSPRERTNTVFALKV
ncbi:MAG: HlyD family secretion protein, partial [Chloroflexota bacterium]